MGIKEKKTGFRLVPRIYQSTGNRISSIISQIIIKTMKVRPCCMNIVFKKDIFQKETLCFKLCQIVL